MPSLFLLYFIPMSGLYKATPSSQSYKTLRSRHRQLCPTLASSEHPLALLAGFSMERRILRPACPSSCYRCEQRQCQRGTLEASHPVLAVHWNSSLTSIPRLNPSQEWGCTPLILRQEVFKIKATPSYIENYIWIKAFSQNKPQFWSFCSGASGPRTLSSFLLPVELLSHYQEVSIMFLNINIF